MIEEIYYWGSCFILLITYHVSLVSPTAVSACEPDYNSGHWPVPAKYDFVSDDSEAKGLESEVGSRIKEI